MGAPFQMEIEIITKGEEKRIRKNHFQLILKGYRLFPLHTPMVVRRKEGEVPSGQGVIDRIELYDGKTIIYYELTKLNTPN